MLARLQRSLAFVPSHLSRQISSTPQCYNRWQLPAEANFEQDNDLDWEKSTPAPTSSTSSVPAPVIPKPQNGLSYAHLPDNEVFLDIPPVADPLLRYLASSLQHSGKRHTATRRASRVLLFLHTLTRTAPLPLLRTAVQRVMPSVRVARHRYSTKEVNIPVALTEKQQVRNAVRWMLKASDSRGGRTVEERLAREIVQVLNGSSSALKQKEILHQMATVNRANIPMPRHTR